MYLSLFDFTKVVIKTIAITHPRDIDCRIINYTPSIICEHLIQLPTTGRFSR